MNVTETYLNNMNIILLHVNNICFATGTTTGKLKLSLNFTVYNNYSLVDSLSLWYR